MKKIYLCQTDEIAEYQTKGFTVEIGEDSLDFFLLKQDGHIRAFLNFCPHLGIPLNWQPDEFLSFEGTHIQCSTHGALFQLEDGYCFSGPCRGDNLTLLNLDITDAGAVYLVSND